MIRSKDPPLISGTQFATIVVLTIALFVMVDFGRRTTAGHYVSQAEKRLTEEIQAELELHQHLMTHLEYVKTDEYVERWARQQAHMARPGDQPIIVITPDAPPAPIPHRIQDETPQLVTSANWHHWWRLFFDTEPGVLQTP